MAETPQANEGDAEDIINPVAALQEARYAGVRSVSYDGKSINYGRVSVSGRDTSRQTGPTSRI